MIPMSVIQSWSELSVEQTIHRSANMQHISLAAPLEKWEMWLFFPHRRKHQSAQERVKGFLDNIANYTDIKVVETVYSDQVDDMKEAMKEVLDKYPALDGVFCTNAEVSEMFLEVNKDAGENKVAMVGVDATSKQQEAIQKGEELGVLSQNPYAMGYQTMWAAIQSTAPKKETKIDKKVLLDPIWIDAENIKSEDIANYLYN